MLLRDLASSRLGLAEGRMERRDIGLEQRTVRVLTDARPVDALLWNLVRVVRALEAAEVDYWLVRPASGLRFVIGARLSQRAQIVRVLARSMAADPTIAARTILPRPRVKQLPLDGTTAGLERRLAGSSVIRVVQHVAAPSSSRTLGEEFSTEIEFWDDLVSDDSPHQFPDELIAPRPGATTRRMRTSEGMVEIPLSRATLFSPRVFDDILIEVPRSQAVVLPGDITFPIDAVYTWVDGNDPDWRASKSEYAPSEEIHEEVDSDSRYASRDELLYSLRSMHDFAPWIRNIYVVTAGQRPVWLDANGEVTVVDHTAIFPEQDHLPTFNSHAIEANIHRIDGLAEHFLYLNDDMFFGRAVPPGLFFFGNGAAKHKLSPSRVPQFSKSEADSPVDLAVKNSREVMDEMFGVRQAQVLEHSPYPLLKSVIEEIEERFPQLVTATSSHRFRDADDLNIPSHLAHHVGYEMCRSFPSNASTFTYIGLHRPDLARLLHRLLTRRDADTFCINDTLDPVDVQAAGPGLQRFFETYFPVPAPWEVVR